MVMWPIVIIIVSFVLKKSFEAPADEDAFKLWHLLSHIILKLGPSLYHVTVLRKFRVRKEVKKNKENNLQLGRHHWKT